MSWAEPRWWLPRKWEREKAFMRSIAIHTTMVRQRPRVVSIGATIWFKYNNFFFAFLRLINDFLVESYIKSKREEKIIRNGTIWLQFNMYTYIPHSFIIFFTLSRVLSPPYTYEHYTYSPSFSHPTRFIEEFLLPDIGLFTANGYIETDNFKTK